MALTIPVAHDFNCKSCWVGLHQAKRLQAEFGVKIDWRGFEMYPETLEWPDPIPRLEGVPDPFALLLWAEQMTLPDVVRPRKMRTFKVHQAVEYAKTEGVGDALIEALYRAFWEEGRLINDPAVLRSVAEGIVTDLDAMERAVNERTFADRIIQFNEEAAKVGVTKIPTFFIGSERIVEKPYAVLRKAVLEAMGQPDAYNLLDRPHPPADRPYVLMNMVTTIDGRIVSGDRDESVHDLGSKVDHLLMKRIEAQADAVMLGAHTLRVTPVKWNPKSPKRFVVTRTGDLPMDACFLTGGESYMVISGDAPVEVPSQTQVLRCEGGRVDMPSLLTKMRAELGVDRLLVMGGSMLNGELLQLDLIDEIFLTIAPKIKLGTNLPGIAEGMPFAREHLPRFTLLEHHVYGDEIFLRYRRTRG